MSSGRIIEALKGLGLTVTEANIYVYLATRGPQRLGNLVDSLKMKEFTIHKSLMSLQVKGLVDLVDCSPAFLALPFDKALDLLVRAHLKEALSIEQGKNEILSKWKTITRHA